MCSSGCKKGWKDVEKCDKGIYFIPKKLFNLYKTIAWSNWNLLWKPFCLKYLELVVLWYWSSSAVYFVYVLTISTFLQCRNSHSSFASNGHSLCIANNKHYSILFFKFWTGCVDGRYGNDCAKNCSKLCKYQACEQTKGVCLHGCLEGYTGWECSERKLLNKLVF